VEVQPENQVFPKIWLGAGAEMKLSPKHLELPYDHRRQARITKTASMRYFIGIDGGGTQTTAWLADEDGRVLGQSMTGPSNPLKVGIQVAARHLVAAARQALRQTQRKPIAVEAVCAGVAGVDRSSLHRSLLAALRKQIPAKHYLLTIDAVIALQSAVGFSPGIIVISGTGSIAYGRNEQDCTLRCGGWGSTFGDEGSGYDLGRKAVMAALQDFDGRGPHTQLNKSICKALRLKGINQVVAKPLTASQIAALFPVVLDAANQGDQVAQRLCREAGQDLAELAWALLKRLDSHRQPIPVICAGGVFKASSTVRQSFTSHLRRRAGKPIRVSLLERPPVAGALDLARAVAEGNYKATPGIFHRADSESPSSR
jgi:glucosamine kinase